MFVVSFVLLIITIGNIFGFNPSSHVLSARYYGLKMLAANMDSLLSSVATNTPVGSVVVVKYGGHAMENDDAKKNFCVFCGDHARDSAWGRSANQENVEHLRGRINLFKWSTSDKSADDGCRTNGLMRFH